MQGIANIGILGLFKVVHDAGLVARRLQIPCVLPVLALSITLVEGC